VTAGGHHSIALKADRTTVAWGNNNYGQCKVPPGQSLAPPLLLLLGN